MGTAVVMKSNHKPMLVADNFMDMVQYIISATTDFSLQERMIQCAHEYKKLTRRYALPIIVNEDRKDGESFYTLNFEEIDEIFAKHVDEYIKRIKG